jgi:hypothetical protein
VLIDPRGADLDLHRDFQEEFCDSFFTTKDPAPPNVHSFLSRHGVVTSNKIKVEEYCIKPKNSLFILGTLGENPGLEVSPQPIHDAEPVNSFSSQGFSLSISAHSLFSNGSEQDFATGSPAQVFATQSESRSHEVIHLSARSGPTKTADMSQQQKIAAALLKAGIASPAAWAAAGVQTANSATLGGVQVLIDPAAPGKGSSADGSPAAPSDAFDPHPPVVLMKGTNNKTFLISWRSQQEVARSLGWKCILMIWGGPALALFSLYVFMSIKHLL